MDVFHSPQIMRDVAFIFLIIIPMFITGMRFMTAPVYLNYSCKLTAFVTPLAALPVFWAHHFDVMLLGILVFIMNFYAFWYHVDPPKNLYQMANKRVRGKRTSEQIIEQMHRREKLQFGGVH